MENRKQYKFIKVHDNDTNGVELYRIDKIMTVYMNQEYEEPCICMTDGSEYFCNETPNRIFEWVKDCGFIKVHSKESNCICIVNLNFVKYIYRNGDETIIEMHSDQDEDIEISINEYPERVYNLIEEYNNGLYTNEVKSKKQKSQKPETVEETDNKETKQ